MHTYITLLKKDITIYFRKFLIDKGAFFNALLFVIILFISYSFKYNIYKMILNYKPMYSGLTSIDLINFFRYFLIFMSFLIALLFFKISIKYDENDFFFLPIKKEALLKYKIIKKYFIYLFLCSSILPAIFSNIFKLSIISSFLFLNLINVTSVFFYYLSYKIESYIKDKKYILVKINIFFFYF